MRTPYSSCKLHAQACFARIHCLGGLGLWDADGDSFGQLLGALGSAAAADPASCVDFTPPSCPNTGALLRACLRVWANMWGRDCAGQA